MKSENRHWRQRRGALDQDRGVQKMRINHPHMSECLLVNELAICGARTRDGDLCARPNAPGRSRCHLHGGAPGSGAPSGGRNGRFRHGGNTKVAIEERKWAKQLIKTLLVEPERDQ